MDGPLVNGSFEMPQIPLTVLLLAAKWGQNLYEIAFYFSIQKKFFNFQPQFCKCTKMWNCTSIQEIEKNTNANL